MKQLLKKKGLLIVISSIRICIFSVTHHYCQDGIKINPSLAVSTVEMMKRLKHTITLLSIKHLKKY